ncbi:IAA-alanine resistance protein 1 [Tripterygium wilfordii]|uniref:IAA-alanine resistance protein 1 n=1 Tax=Tripterygium wilfordii TaxID=458696 RepID=A0A7J7DV77_TRIWF|nr:IAA-alanine resistance protein 1-like [Tripterygium wilfordii]KAF5750064.1 IAA-alanine resistance protein 1 [Tripterygium wilfordii]
MRMSSRHKWSSLLLLAVVLCLCFDLRLGSGSCSTPQHEDLHGHHYHQCDHGHGDHHHHNHQHRHVDSHEQKKRMLLPEELAEEEDMMRNGFGSYRHDDDHEYEHHGSSKLSGLGLWFRALGCSLLVSLASFICLIILPVIFIQGKLSKAVVDSLALFGAGAMLGDAFLHQLPHAFGGEQSHSHDQHADLPHHFHVGSGHSHSHSLTDLSVGISVLSGILLFLVVEKLVRYVEDNSGAANTWSHSHHNHHHKMNRNLNNDNNDNEKTSSRSSQRKELHERTDDSLDGDNLSQNESLWKRKMTSGTGDVKPEVDADNSFSDGIASLTKEKPAKSPSNLVFGYLNLFSDGVHNFTDGMALGSAFLLYGSVGGWSRTLFLLAHELPQEIGDFGILVSSGFTIPKALFFNFLSALVALAGTASALLLGHDPGQSSLIEGFTAGGFIYIAVAGVLAEMNSSGKTTFRSIAIQLTSLIIGMAVALCISLVE